MGRFRGLVVTTGTTENRTDGGLTVEGEATIGSTGNNPLIVKSTNSNGNVYVQLNGNDTDQKCEVGYWDWTASVSGKIGAYIQNEAGTNKHTLILLNNGNLTFDDNVVYHAGNSNTTGISWTCAHLLLKYYAYFNTGGNGIYISGSGIHYHNSSNTWIADIMSVPDSSGNVYFPHNVAIGGEDSNLSQLSVRGTVYINQHQAASYQSSPALCFNKGGDYFAFGSSSSDSSSFAMGTVDYNNGWNWKSEVLTIDYYGNFNFNHHIYLTGSQASSSTNNTTQIVFGTTSNNHVVLSSNDNLFIVNPSTTTTTGQACIGVNGKNTWFTSSGNFGIGTSSPSAKLHVAGNIYATAAFESSDERLKNFGEDIEIDFEKLGALRKKYFSWKDKPESKELGVSAQEIREIYPEIVREDNEGYLHVDYAKLSVVALAAIDKQEEKIAQISKELSSLKEMFYEFKSKL